MNASVDETDTSIGQVVTSAAPMPTTTHAAYGYCAGCGSWDAHQIRCESCGYDFGGEPEPLTVKPDLDL